MTDTLSSHSPNGLRSGFVTVVGRPNVGKSTLVNALVGRKVAIVSPHPQTTRTHLLGILNLAAAADRPAAQIVFVDTPGVHSGRGRLGREMLRSVRTGLQFRDLAIWLVDATRRFGAEDAAALELVQPPSSPTSPEAAAGSPVILVLNKVDLVRDKRKLLPALEELRGRGNFDEIVPVSALRGENLPSLVRAIVDRLPEGPEYYPPTQSTDQPESFLISEIIREKAMLATREEVPQTLAVLIEHDEAKPTIRNIAGVIYCERPGQKAILIGHGGEMIRRIGMQARTDIEALIGGPIYLELHVAVRESWRNNPRFLRELDFRS